MFRPLLPNHELPMTAFTNEVMYYLDQNPNPAQCPFSAHFEETYLHNPAAYTTRTPELAKPENYRTIRDRIRDIQYLINAASMGTRRIYRPAHNFLSQQQFPDDQTLTVIRNSLPMAHHYASIKAEHAREIAIAARAPGTFHGLHDRDSNLVSLNFTSEFIRNKIQPLRAKGFGCSLLGVVVVSPHDGKRYNAFDLYWDAFVVDAHRRQQRIAAQTRSAAFNLAQ